MCNAGIENKDSGDVGGAGSRSIAGYEYQIDVSVWLALDLVVANRLTHELILEPATEEDIEADLEEFEPGRITNTASVDGYRLIVQAKLRTGDAWTVPKVLSLLKHGKVRESAEKRLKDPSARYLLVTSAGLNGLTRDLKVRHAGSWRNAETMPKLIRNALPKDAAGRVAIIGNQDEERLTADIKELLTVGFRVPNSRLGECRGRLREEARMRMAGTGRGRWTRQQLEKIIRKYDGYIASSPELENYVHPTNWQDLISMVQRKNAALIIGQSGTGKTMASHQLYEELRKNIPGLARVPITLGPGQLLGDKTEPPVFYDIEDPWGRYDFDPQSRPWNDQLTRIFSSARHNQIIVATSRLDVAQETGMLDSVTSWQYRLEAEHYEAPQRQNLYRTRINALPRKLHALARHNEKSVLAELTTPLEIQKFFDALPTMEHEERFHPNALVSEAIHLAHKDSIELTVINQIEARKDVRAATVIWGLLKANDKFHLKLLYRIEEKIAGVGSQYEKGVMPLINFLVAARNLRQTGTTITYYHPRVEAGIEKTLCRDRIISKKTLHYLTEIMVSLEGEDELWGVASAARMLLAFDRIPEIKPDLSQVTTKKIDSWIANELAKGGNEFYANLELAKTLGSQLSDVSEVARFLLNREDDTFASIETWAQPVRDNAWYERMRENSDVNALIKEFIQEILPVTRTSFEKIFAAEMERLSPGLSPAFLIAASKAVYSGFTNASDVIAEGAMWDIAGFEAIIDTAIEVIIPSEADLIEREEQQLAITNGEYDDDYVNYLTSDDEGWTARKFLEAYVHKVRKTSGWQNLLKHRHSQTLISFWFRDLLKEGELTAEEVTDAFIIGYDTKNEENVWLMLTDNWSPKFLEALIQRLNKGHNLQAVRVAALTCLVLNEPSQLSEILQTLQQENRLDRLVELAIELGEMRYRRYDFEVPSVAQTAEAAYAATVMLPPLYQEISDAALGLNMITISPLSNPCRELLTELIPGTEAIQEFRTRLSRHVPMFVPSDIFWLLTHTNKSDIAAEAIDVAIRHNMVDEINAGLSHRFSEVIARSLKAIVTPLSPPLSNKFLDLASNRGGPVRLALVELLNSKPHPEHLSTLLSLAKDELSRHPRFPGDNGTYPIARSAIAAIAKVGKIDVEAGSELFELAIDTRDSLLRNEILTLLARSADSHFQDQLFELAKSPHHQRNLRRSAANALLMADAQHLSTVTVQITPELLASQIEDIASRLLLLLSAKGEISHLLIVAQVLAANCERRVLLIIAILCIREKNMPVAAQIASMLPANHIAVTWALNGGEDELDSAALDDLGDPLCVEQVFSFSQKNKGN
ncbi:MAG: hypothetical protein V4495_19950 [Pseudomonadota bacterium]